MLILHRINRTFTLHQYVSTRQYFHFAYDNAAKLITYTCDFHIYTWRIFDEFNRITNYVKGYKKHTSLLLIQPYLIYKIRSSEFRRRVKKRVDTFVVSLIFLWTASCEAEINVKTGSVQLGFLEIKLATLSEARGVFPGRWCDAMRCA